MASNARIVASVLRLQTQKVIKKIEAERKRRLDNLKLKTETFLWFKLEPSLEAKYSAEIYAWGDLKKMKKLHSLASIVEPAEFVNISAEDADVLYRWSE